jgi:hypothetical protein
VNTIEKLDVAQRVENLLSCIQIYGCATRGTKFLHIRKEVTTVAYWMAAQNCSGSEYRCPPSVRASARPNGDMPAYLEYVIQRTCDLNFLPERKRKQQFISSQSGHPTALRRLPRHTPSNAL